MPAQASGTAEHGAVVGGDPREAEAGMAMLRVGGNAADAVVAAAFVGYVVEPWNCGVGGYGRLAAHMAGRLRSLVVDGFSIAPGKMPIHAAPVLILLQGSQPVFGTCGSGGYRIETGCLHTLVNTLDHRMEVQEAANTPRVHCQGRETFVDERIPIAVRDELAARGHEVIAQPHSASANNFGRVAALHRAADGSIHFAASPADAMGGCGY